MAAALASELGGPVTTVTLPDLLSLAPAPAYIMKLDIQGWDCQVGPSPGRRCMQGMAMLHELSSLIPRPWRPRACSPAAWSCPTSRWSTAGTPPAAGTTTR